MVKKPTAIQPSMDTAENLARITSADFRIEDHGILAFNVAFEAITGGWGQGTGYYAVDRPQRFGDYSGKEAPRVGNRSGVAFIRMFLDHFQVYTLDGLEDKECFIYRKDNSHNGTIVGVRWTRAKEALMFRDILETIGEDDYEATVTA